MTKKRPSPFVGATAAAATASSLLLLFPPPAASFVPTTVTAGVRRQRAAASAAVVDDNAAADPVAAGGGESDLEMRDRILREIDQGIRQYPAWIDEEYGEPELEGGEYVDDDPDALDPTTLGQWNETDLLDKFDYEWDPEAGDPDPNELDPLFEYVEEIPKDDEGVEVGYDPIFGPSHPVDSRTIINPPDSYVIDDLTRDDAVVTPTFPPGDMEIEYNKNIKDFRRSLKIVETYEDELSGLTVPRHSAKWHGYPEKINLPEKPFENNRFTDPKDKTDFDSMTPGKARKIAVQFARAKNNEWLPAGTSEAYHKSKTDIYRKKKLLVGSTLPGDKDPGIVDKIRPALDILGDCAELLSIEMDTVFRFHYHGLIKNKRGMEAWTATLIRDCDVECTGVVFETGRRKRDPYYDGGDHWYGPY